MAKGKPGKGWSAKDSVEASRSPKHGAKIYQRDDTNKSNTHNQGPDGTTGPTPSMLPAATMEDRNTGKVKLFSGQVIHNAENTD